MPAKAATSCRPNSTLHAQLRLSVCYSFIIAFYSCKFPLPDKSKFVALAIVAIKEYIPGP